ncbi:hypothetical protein Tco_0157572 [Tanacetum coccineum]
MNYYEPNPCYDSNYSGFDQIEPPQFPVIHQPPQEMSIQDMEDLKQQYLDEMKTLINKKDYRNREIDIEIKINELKGNFNRMSIEINKKKELRKLEHVANLSTYPSRHFNSFCYDDDDDDDEEYTIAITPDLPTDELVDSLIMENEHLDTISATESDEVIKSSVENLVPSPSELEDLSDGECDLSLYDDSPKSHLTFSNPLFDIDDDFTSSDDELFSEEDVPMENFKFFSNPLFDLDEEIISTEVNLIQNEVLESITLIPSGIDSFDAKSNLIESLLNRNTSIDSSSKIDSLLDEFAGELTILKSIPPRIDHDNLDPEGEIHLVERLLYENSSPRPSKELNVENSIESFSPSPIPVEDSDSLMEEIDLFLTPDDSMPPGIENDDYDSEWDILFLEEFLSNDSSTLPENESFHFNIPSSPRPPAKPPDDGIYFEPDTGILTVKVDCPDFEASRARAITRESPLILGRSLLRTRLCLIGWSSRKGDDPTVTEILEDLFATNHPSGNPTSSLTSHTDLTSPKVNDDIFDPEGGIIENLLNLDKTKDLPPYHDNPLSGSTTSSSPSLPISETSGLFS